MPVDRPDPAYFHAVLDHIRNLVAGFGRQVNRLKLGGFMRRLGIAVIVLLALTAQPAFNQTVTATLVGAVTDATGARVPGATVTATHKATNNARTVRTGAEGGYTIPLLPPGVYSVQAEQSGFKRTLWTASNCRWTRRRAWT